MQNSKKSGRFTFVLHSHLPYVISHGKWPHGMVWLSEAAAESYIPLLRAFTNSYQKGYKIPVTLGITPVLAEQLSDKSFDYEFIEYLKMKQETSRADLKEFTRLKDKEMTGIAEYWINYYENVEKDYIEKYHRNIVGAFKELQDKGALEIITCAATHGYLPLLGSDIAVEAQIRVGVETYRKHFNRDPKGIWLPECAYRPGYNWVNPTDPDSQGIDRNGIEKYLEKYGIKYFIVDSHLLKGGKAMGVYLERFEGLKQLWMQSGGDLEPLIREEDYQKSPYRLHWVGNPGEDRKPVGILTRDEETSLLVWSGKHGYPGDGHYLDFHKMRFPGGHRYWRVTESSADLGDKEVYEINKVDDRLNENSDHFISKIAEVMAAAEEVKSQDKVVISPFDTELFGHWWFEGPRWLEKVIEKLNKVDSIEASNGGEMFDNLTEAPMVDLPEGSWGEGGFHYIWFNKDTKWTWPIIYKAESDMTSFVRKYQNLKGFELEILSQMARELLLLESSDWQFLISTFSARDYAEMRFREHSQNFNFLRDLLHSVLKKENIPEEKLVKLKDIQDRDSLFEDLNPYYWA